MDGTNPMKTNTCRLSVGLVGFLRYETASTVGDARSTSSLVGFAGRPMDPDLEPDRKSPAAEEHPRPRDRRNHSATPDSRHPLIFPEVRTKIEAIEAEARAKGWPAELLWNGGYWDRPRGLAAVLEAGDEIAGVTTECIVVLKKRHDLLRFQRHVA
jgi:hypothetical protein